MSDDIPRSRPMRYAEAKLEFDKRTPRAPAVTWQNALFLLLLLALVTALGT